MHAQSQQYKRCNICSKLIIQTPERRHWRRSRVFIAKFKHITQLLLAFLLIKLNRQMFTGKLWENRIILEIFEWLCVLFWNQSISEAYLEHCQATLMSLCEGAYTSNIYLHNNLYKVEPRIWKSAVYYVTAICSTKTVSTRLTYHRQISHDLQWLISISNIHYI